MRMLGLVTLLSITALVSAEDFVPKGQRGEKAIAGGKIRFWPARPDQAEVLQAGFLGGKGHEWLVSGGFQSDGTIVLCGNVAGGIFDFTLKETVIGTDGTRPSNDPVLTAEKGKQGKLSWQASNVTGFVARLAPDGKKLLSLSRMPWNSGAITAAVVDRTGNIYLAGKATDQIKLLGGNYAELNISPDTTRKGGGCDHTFIAKLSPDATKVEWLRSSRGLSDAPSLKILKNESICLGAQDVRTFDASGKQLTVATIPGGVRETTSVSPVDGIIVKGGEHHWATGREPWRCPILNTHLPDGTLQYQLYDWGGPYVGLDNCRQVSDSAVRLVTHDMEGNILFVAWSDGGNSVMTTQPTDVRRSVGYKGLGLNAAGAGVLSCCYFIKVEPKNLQVVGWTFWSSNYNGKPNGIGANVLHQSQDGSMLMAGTSAWGLVQTLNRVGDGEPAGNYLAIFNRDLTGVRFCSAMPGTGVTQIGNDRKDTWGIASGVVNGQGRALFLSGAIQQEDVYGLVSKTPVKGAFQNSFGGGLSDGYFAVLDLGPVPDKIPATVPPESKVVRLRPGAPAKPKKGVSEAPPADGTTFYFSATFPKHVTVDIEARDTKGLKWPNFLYGKPVEGTVVYKGGNPVANLSVACTNW